jgi:phosphoketolase
MAFTFDAEQAARNFRRPGKPMARLRMGSASLSSLGDGGSSKVISARGCKEEGTTTTPFDIVVLNDLDRFHLVGDVIDRVPGLGARTAYAKQAIRDKLIEHRT